MQLTALDDLDGCANSLLNCVGKRLALVAAINQHVLHFPQTVLVSSYHSNRPGLVAHIGRGDVQDMRQAIGIHGNVPLDAVYLLPGVIAFLLGCISVLDGLGVNNQKSGARVATMVLSGLAN